MLLRLLVAMFTIFVLSLGIAIEPGAQQPPNQQRDLNLSYGASVRLPTNWTSGPTHHEGTYQLVGSPGRRGRTSARTVVTVERQTDHSAALRRLAEAVAETSAPSRYLLIAGWPAIERRYIAQPEQAGESEGESEGPGRATEKSEELILHLTTVIAADNLLVRLETRVLGPTRSSFSRPPRRQLVDQALAIGRGFVASVPGAADTAAKEIESLREAAPKPQNRKQVRRKGSTHQLPLVGAAPSPAAVVVAQTLGELEIAVSVDGQNIVIAANTGYAVSNGGSPFVFHPRGEVVPFETEGDPSVATAPSGAFYLAYVGLPDGQPGAGGVRGCSTAISKSTDNGNHFNFVGHAAFCPITGRCLPDQPHIAVDPVARGDNGADQLYSVYRSCSGTGTETTCRDTASLCRGAPSIVCSKDGGNTWGTPRLIESGRADFPRVAVARDGFVYVIYRNGDLLKITKYSSCASGLIPEPEFPVTIPMPNHVLCSAGELLDNCHCPIPGIDRCNNGNLLSSPTVAVDDTDPSHIYVAYAAHTSPDNDDIVVASSTDGGKTWPNQVTLNKTTDARRFMPWVCSLNGRAYVTWYDRRAATVSDNDLTDYYLGMATIDGEALRSGPELNVTGNPDPQCSARGPASSIAWPAAPRETRDSESCSRQPQFAGRCSRVGTACDFSDRCSSPKFACLPGKGAPKYGDYNGNACAAGSIYAAWASARAPVGLQGSTPPADSIIRLYSATIPASGGP